MLFGIPPSSSVRGKVKCPYRGPLSIKQHVLEGKVGIGGPFCRSENTQRPCEEYFTNMTTRNVKNLLAL